MQTTFKERNLVGKGGINELVSIVFPVVVSAACITIMTVTDRLFLSKLGSDQMNAAMIGGLTQFMFISFFIGVIGYGTAMVAQQVGAGNKLRCPRIVFQTLYVSLFASPIVIACIPIGHALFDSSGHSPSQLAYEKDYFSILMFSGIFTLFYNGFCCFFSGVGKTRIIMYSSIVSCIVNIGFNYVLIFGKFGLPALEIHGAAYGTILSSFVGLLVIMFAYFNPKHRLKNSISWYYPPSKSIIYNLFRFGGPSGIEFLLNFAAFNLLVITFHSYGETVATAATIALNWDMISFVPMIGLGIGVTSLFGRYMGAQDEESAKRTVHSGLKVSISYALFCLLIFITCTYPMIQFFEPNEQKEVFQQSVPLAIFMVRTISIYVLFSATFTVFSGALKGAGDTLWIMVASVLTHWSFVGGIIFMIRKGGADPKTSWWIFILMVIVLCALYFMRYQSGAWKKIGAIKR
ncbi:MAG: MATE family efflux transporter [Lentisphaeria bacterium]|nr:MATE family efflux transporter [Lentisphaeria bacterium]